MRTILAIAAGVIIGVIVTFAINQPAPDGDMADSGPPMIPSHDLPLATAEQLAHEGPLDPNDPNDAIRIRLKASCSMETGKEVLHWWKGNMYSRRAGERDRLLFKVQGMNMRTCAALYDEERGLGWRSVSREVMFYMDPETEEIVDTWENPWTGEVVDVIHVANDPVNLREPRYAYDEEGNPAATFSGFEHDGFHLSGGGAATLFYKNPLAGEYQDYVGGTYHAMEFGTDAMNLEQLNDPNSTEVSDKVISWGRISKYLPWMKMGDKDGVVVFHTAGLRLNDFEEMPDVIKEKIRADYPEYETPPPVDDWRANETSWTVMKDFIDGKRASGEYETPQGE